MLKKKCLVWGETEGRMLAHRNLYRRATEEEINGADAHDLDQPSLIASALGRGGSRYGSEYGSLSHDPLD
jgi:hypothetical protein